MKQRKDRLVKRAARIDEFWSARLRGARGVERLEIAVDYLRAQAKVLPGPEQARVYEKAADDLVNLVEQAVHTFTSGSDVKSSPVLRAQVRAGARARESQV